MAAALHAIAANTAGERSIVCPVLTVVVEEDTEAIAVEVAELRALRKKTGLGLFIVSTDQEGGIVGHATQSAVDAHNPASLSRKFIQGIVRNRWGHETVLVTDDMAMAPVVCHGMCYAGMDAINAGTDLLLVSYDSDQYYTIMHCLIQAQIDGRLLRKQLLASGLRLQSVFSLERDAHDQRGKGMSVRQLTVWALTKAYILREQAVLQSQCQHVECT